MKKEHKPVQINAEGELTGGMFCEYCGELNRAEAAECEHCHEHIADQGPDLHSRLQRIHRHASNSQEFSDIADGGIGTVPYERHERHEQPSLSLFEIRLTPGAVLSVSLFVLCLAVLSLQPSGTPKQIPFVIGFFTVISFCAIVAAMMDSKSR